MQEENERDDPGQNHVSGSHHEARTEHIFEHVPALAACQRLHPRPAARARSRAHTPRAAWMVTERTLLCPEDVTMKCAAERRRQPDSRRTERRRGGPVSLRSREKVQDRNQSVMWSPPRLVHGVKAQICQQYPATGSREGHVR